MRHRFNVLRISLRTMLVLVALCAIGFKWHREIRDSGRDLLFYPWYRLDDERLGADESGRTFDRVAFSPDGKTLATVCERRDKQTIALWDVPARRLSWEADLGKRGYDTGLLFAADGKTVVTIDSDKPTSNDGYGPPKAIRWNVADGRRLSTAVIDDISIWSLSPDGNTLALGSSKLTLQDLRSGATIAELEVGSISALALRPTDVRWRLG